MKIRNCMALICAVVALSACGRTVIMREGNSSEGTSSAVIEPVAVGKKTAKEKIDLSGLSHDKVGYGQGVLVDEKNRTTGALDFNAQYGKLNAKAINNDDKIYLTFDQGYENGYTEKILDVLKEKKVKATFFLLQAFLFHARIPWYFVLPRGAYCGKSFGTPLFYADAWTGGM